MQLKWKTFFIKLSVWIASEILLNFLGLDNLADYSEFVFEQDLTYHSQVTTLNWRTINGYANREKSTLSQRRV
jgi:hypothetical protein